MGILYTGTLTRQTCEATTTPNATRTQIPTLSMQATFTKRKSRNQSSTDIRCPEEETRLLSPESIRMDHARRSFPFYFSMPATPSLSRLPFSKFLVKAVFVASLGGILFGCECVPYFEGYFLPTGDVLNSNILVFIAFIPFPFASCIIVQPTFIALKHR